MARKLRLQFAGALYHVMNRGDRREAIVRDDLDRQRFLDTLEQATEKAGWRVHAFCLLPDHFHLVLQTPSPNLVEGMKWLLGTYTARFNRRHQMGGHLFSGRYKSQLLDPELSGVPSQVALYLHQNPLRSKLVQSPSGLGNYSWSSYGEYLKPRETRLAWIKTELVLRDAGFSDDENGLRQFRDATETVDALADPEIWRRWRTGWYVGSDDYRRGLLDRLHEQRDDKSTGLVWRASAEHQAEKLVQHTLNTLGWSEQELGRRLKTDPEKVFIARQLRTQTTLPLTWIAKRLQMGSRNTLRNALAADLASTPFRSPDSGTVSSGKSVSTPVSIAPLRPSLNSSSLTVEPGWD